VPKDKEHTIHIVAHKTDSAPEDSADDGEELSDAQLVPLVKKGVQWASDRLIQRHYSAARTLVYNMCDKNAADTEDITQQAFLNALNHIGAFEEKAAFKTWFYRILVNTCLDARRRRRRWLGVFASPLIRRKDGDTVSLSPDDFPDEADGNDPSRIFRENQLRSDIQKTLGLLPEKQRLVFQLKVLQEFSIPEISEILELAPGTVKSHLFRATRMMREALAEWAGR
jgi:RNA polymerase sigma-70 factor (ECF subfamily)